MRFSLLMVLCAGLLAATATPAADERFSGRQAWEIARKMTCGTLEEGVTRYGVFGGRAYSRVPGEKDRHLFDVLGVNTRQCASVADPEKGEGFRSVSREVMLYLDPESGEILREWRNPWTGETVEVVQVANDPVNMRAPRFEAEQREIVMQRNGEILIGASEVPLFYDNPLGSDYQDYIGGHYHAMEIFDMFYPADQLLDSKRRVERSWIAWVRVAQWLPWMKMGSRPGLMIFNATGSSTFDRAEIPEPLRSELERNYPRYFEPPPLDDRRPNETSWTVFRKHLEQAGD
ncbi:MAG: DUF1838 domain-containing protein [Gammaproteobacteria bacterium]|nr:MAG: DUF1838 domain-containing protein [Gammaproteobacteria bacterium]